VLCISCLLTSTAFIIPTVSLAGKTLTINVFLKILGAKGAEDYWQSAVYQLFTDQGGWIGLL